MTPTTRLVLLAALLPLAACGGTQSSGDHTTQPLAGEEQADTEEVSEPITVYTIAEPGTVEVFMAEPDHAVRAPESPPCDEEIAALIASTTLPDGDAFPDAHQWFSAITVELSPIISALGHRASSDATPESRICTLAWMHDTVLLLHDAAAHIGAVQPDDPEVPMGFFAVITEELAGQARTVEDELATHDATPQSCPYRERFQRPAWMRE